MVMFRQRWRKEKKKRNMFSGELHEMYIFEITSGFLLSETEWWSQRVSNVNVFCSNEAGELVCFVQSCFTLWDSFFFLLFF